MDPIINPLSITDRCWHSTLFLDEVIPEIGEKSSRMQYGTIALSTSAPTITGQNKSELFCTHIKTTHCTLTKEDRRYRSPRNGA